MTFCTEFRLVQVCNALNKMRLRSGGKVVKGRKLVKKAILPKLAGMLEKSRRRLVAGALVVLAIAVFGAGINWGLPSHTIDSILFGAGPGSAVTALNSYNLTGVGINRLVGNWDDAGNLPADVAAHPIGDRSKPVTLLENPHHATEEEIIQQGDRELARLSAVADAADRKYGELRVTSDEKAADKAKEESLAAQQKVNQYVEDFNRKNFGDLTEAIHDDQVSRARILSRFRLYSYQPDEMISFRALAKMHPGNLEFDPKLYQYGGLWIYPLGAIVKAASLVGYVTVSPDPTLYLDSPEMFGRFYVLGRAYSAAWGLVAVLAVFGIVRRVTGGLVLPFLAGVCFMCMPVVLDLAHEAKPHLAGTALMLLAVLSASKYVETGKGKWIVWTAIACGACAGMVLSGVVALAILPVMALVRRDGVGRFLSVCGGGVLIAAAVYFATNPYVAVHLVGDRSILQANLANTRAMYSVGDAGSNTGNAFRLLLAGASVPVAAFGALWLLGALFSKRELPLRGMGWLLVVPAVVVLIQFDLFAGNKPGEYARFALFADTALLMAAFIGIGRIFRSVPLQAVAGIVVVGFTILHSAAYERGFVDDSLSDDSRLREAAAIDGRLADAGPSPVLYIMSEPAPYCLPPVNLFRWRVILLPPDGEIPAGFPAGVLVKPRQEFEVMDPSATPISWANMGFDMADVGGK